MSKRVLLRGGPTPGVIEFEDNYVAYLDEHMGGWYRKTGEKVTVEVWAYEPPVFDDER